MKKISSQKLCEILKFKNRIVQVEICGVSTDSRNCSRNDVFIAIAGEKFDGHDFVAGVIDAGCPLAIVNHYVPNVPVERQIVVADTLDAYGKIGVYNRSLFTGTVIGLTGSAGKTTTKEELKFILSHFGKTYATPGNHNNFVGVPESLCNLDMQADYAIIEMGMSSKGEISRLVSYVQPDVAIVTNVYPMHIEFFENLQGIAEAKAEIFEGLHKGSKAIINADTNFADLLEQRAISQGAKVCKFGRDYAPKAQFETAVDGEHYRSNAWCVLKVVESLGLDVVKAARYIKDFGALDGRGKHHTLTLPDGKGTYTLIDDSYSGQPEAMKFAITALNQLPRTKTPDALSHRKNGRKIALLGKMAELGVHSQAKHIEIGKVLAETDIDIVIGVCPEMKEMLAQLPKEKEQYYFDDKNNLTSFLLNQILQNGDIVLIKGARYSSKLYQVAEELIKKGSKA